MQKKDGRFVYSPTDLVKFLDDPFVSWMDRYEGDHPGTYQRDPDEPSLWASEGYRHESETLAKLEERFGPAVNLQEKDKDGSLTIRAMREGRPVIFQGVLRKDDFRGFSDFLVRVEGASSLGDYHYEVWDTKLARAAKPAYAIQLCCYCEMLEAIQGRRPAHFTVFLGDGREARYRTEDFYYYYEQTKRAFMEAQTNFDPAAMPIPSTDDCGRWSTFASRRLEELDHLARVANLSSVHVKRYEAAGLGTMRALGAAAPTDRPADVEANIFEKHARQARLQIASRGLSRPTFEVLRHEPGGCVGLAALPPADAGDVYFDLEGYPLVVGGLEYLWGVVFLEEKTPLFRDWWAHDADEEKRAFEHFMDWLTARWTKNPGLHVYHYGHYEIGVLKRLADRYSTRQEALDQMLRKIVFVDLYAVVRHGIAVGEPRYSIKNVERIYGQVRTGLVGAAGDSIVEYHRWRLTPAADAGRPAILKAIRDYNEDDCRSTLALTEWLRDLQRKNRVSHRSPAPAKSGGEDETERMAPEPVRRRQEMIERLRAFVPPAGPRDDTRRVVELVADLLGFYAREIRPQYWALFDRLQNHAAADLYHDHECLAELTRTDAPPVMITKPRSRRVHLEYRFDPRQETKFETGKSCVFHHDRFLKATIEELDYAGGRVVLSLSDDDDEAIAVLPNVVAVLPAVRDMNAVLEKALLAVAEALADGLPARLELPKALRDVLLRRPPDTSARAAGAPLIRDEASLVAEVTEIALGLRAGALCLQGPPGTGKTYTASHVILGLLRAGKRVGVTSNSHKAIDNLLRRVRAVARDAAFDFVGCTIGPDQADVAEELGFHFFKSGSDYYKAKRAQLVGGTVWAFAGDAAIEQYDYLFVEEAGQFALAHLVAASRSGTNLILLGDPLQLEHPTQGTHPNDSGLSCLPYFMAGHQTMPPELGVFLPVTYRLHPEICRFISGAVYEDRLHPHPSATDRTIVWTDGGALGLKPAGVQFYPVAHEGNSNSSDEEVAAIRAIVAHALKHGRITGPKGPRAITLADIMFIAPYNMQRARLQSAFPGARVGTVDLFQGQEAPIVILSMCSSSSELTSRGLEFLFSRNRINVAVSRAQILAIVVGHPGLSRSRANSVEKMALVNLFCRLVAEGRA